jgi:hypothetical protein
VAPLLCHKALQRLVQAPPKDFPGLNRLEPRERRAGGWREWPMDGHGWCANVLDGGVTARAVRCHSYPLRGPLPTRAMMARTGAGASHVPYADPNTPCQVHLTSAPGPSLRKERQSHGPSWGSPGHALVWMYRSAILSPSSKVNPGGSPRAAPCPACHVLLVLPYYVGTLLSCSACPPQGCLHQR